MLLVACLAGVALIVLWPSPVDSDSKGMLLRALMWLHGHGLPGFIGYDEVEFAANALMFAPLGALGAVVLGPRRWWIAIFAGPALSVLIESIQAVALPGRFATVGDVAANSLGCLLGALLGRAAIARLRELPRTDGATGSDQPK